MIYKLHIEAFVADEALAQALAQAQEHRDLAKSRVQVRPGGLPTAITHYAENPTAPVILVEETGSDEELLHSLGQLAEVCEPGTKVIVVGHLNDIGLYRTLIAQGVSDYLVAPVTGHQILESLRAIFADPAAPPRGKLFAFYGARGGVGVSTLAQNAAWSLAETIADDVIYIDLDLSFGTSSLSFNLDVKQSVAEVLAQPERVDTVLLERFLVRYGDRLQVMMSGADLRAAAGLDIGGVERVLEVARQMAAYVIVDVPHVWAPWSEFILRHADDLVVVALPDLANLRDTKNLVDAVISRRGESLPSRVVLNRVDAYKKTQLSAKDFQETIGFAPVLSVPFEPNLFGTAANNGQMLGEAAKTHKIVDSVRQLALQMAGRVPTVRKPAGFMARLKADLMSKKRA